MTDMWRANSNSVDFGWMKDVDLDKDKDSITQQSKEWKGGSRTERRENKANDKELRRKAMERTRQAQTEPGQMKKKILSGVALLFMFGVGFFQFAMTIYDGIKGDGVTHLDVQDSAQLKSVLFGGEPWLVYCVNNYTEKQKLPTIITESSGPLWSSLGVQIGVLRCWDDMASGRSVAKRFNLKLSAPLLFFVANGNKPKTVEMVGLKQPEELEKLIKPSMEVKIDKIDKIKKWPSSCTSRRTCVVVGYKQSAQKDTAVNLITPILQKHRGTKFVTVDTAFWQLKLHESLLKTRPAKEGSSKDNKGADVLCLARDEAKEAGGNATYSGTFLKDLSASAMTLFVKACEYRSGLVDMPEAPKLSARKTKPKKVKPPTPRPPTPRPPTPPASRPQPKPRGNVDSVGSRASMEKQAEEEALFEAVQEEEEEEESEEEEDDGGEEVEL